MRSPRKGTEVLVQEPPQSQHVAGIARTTDGLVATPATSTHAELMLAQRAHMDAAKRGTAIAHQPAGESSKAAAPASTASATAGQVHASKVSWLFMPSKDYLYIALLMCCHARKQGVINPDHSLLAYSFTLNIHE